MKNILITFLFIAVFSAISSAQQAKKYAVKSGYLKLELSGNTVGTKEIWWDNYGQKTAEHEKSATTTKIFGMKSVDEKNQLTIIVNDQFWTVNYIENTGTKGKLPYYDESVEYANSLSEKEAEELAEEILASMGGQKLAPETLSTYKCDVISVMGVKSWIYRGITLKTEGKLMGIETKEMFSDFKPGTAVAASKFTPPANIRFKDLSQEQKVSGFGSFMEALEGMDEDDLDDDEKTVPVKYPFEKFKKVVEGFTYPGYTRRGINTLDGVHAATFTKGLSSSIMLVATSRKNSVHNVEEGFEQFTHNGHTCYYGEINDEETEGTALVVEYPAYDMYIVITAMPDMDRKTMLSIVDNLKF